MASNEDSGGRAPYSRPRPSGLTRLLLRMPILVYRAHLGWILGHRFLMLAHVGRKTGRIRRNVVEVFHYDREKRESFAMSGWGAKSDWYLNIMKNPPIEVQTGRQRFVPRFRVLSLDEAREVLKQVSLEHPHESSFFLKSFFKGTERSLEDIAGLVPIVAFRPEIGASGAME